MSTYSYCGLGSTGVSNSNRQGAFWGGRALATLKAAYAVAPHWRGTFLASTPAVDAPWHAWTYNGDQVAGYATTYKTPTNFSFVTVRGGRHEVPETAPAQAAELLRRLIAGEAF